jgi:hypothetical protein
MKTAAAARVASRSAHNLAFRRPDVSLLWAYGMWWHPTPSRVWVGRLVVCGLVVSHGARPRLQMAAEAKLAEAAGSRSSAGAKPDARAIVLATERARAAKEPVDPLGPPLHVHA